MVTSNRVVINRAQAPRTSQKSTVKFKLTSSQKTAVHKARRDQNSINVKITYNNHLQNFIKFLKETVEANPGIVENGSIDDLVKSVDFSDDDVDQMQYVCSKKKIRNRNEWK